MDDQSEFDLEGQGQPSGIDYAPPVAAPAAAPTPPPGLTVTPVTQMRGPQPPSDPRADLIRRQTAANNQLWQNLQRKVGNLPIAQAEAAVGAAMRFQGQRQYQMDLGAGVPPAEALARSAPMMFWQPRSASLGQAASFIRATTPTSPKIHNAGG